MIRNSSYSKGVSPTKAHHFGLFPSLWLFQSQSEAASGLLSNLSFTNLSMAKVLSTGIHRLYTTESQSWVEAHFVAMAQKSQAFITVCEALQAYLEDGFSVPSMERVDHALQTFRSELETRQNSFDASTVSAGLLLCSLCVSSRSNPHEFLIISSAKSCNTCYRGK